MNYEQLVAQYEVWVAHYRSSLNQNYYINDYSMFQYSSTGTVAGVTTDVDLNVSYKNYPAIIKKFGYNGYGG
jgi:GH25 family lysozyme M1 (1,4-beta-N-acetylmuramidase)